MKNIKVYLLYLTIIKT
ncbi:hypothetical protein Gotur_017196 [Gossypium turneri]